MTMKKSEYFAPEEFARCVPACSIDDMDQELLTLMDALRKACGIPLVINCAYRSPEWDTARGRSGNSAHTEGTAVDIRCTDTHTRMLIVREALTLGITRIGIASSFVHIDISKKLNPEQLWTY